MDKSNNYFIISGFISISLFIVFVFMFFYMLFSSNKLKTFALKKDNYISISIETPLKNVKTFKKSFKKSTPTNEDKTISDISKDVDIKNLFNDVWTRKIKKTTPKKRKVDLRHIQKIQKKSKTFSDNKVKSLSNIVQNEVKKDSTSNEVNEYLAKIQALVYEHFFPPQNSYGYSVKAVIELSAIGKVMDFRILDYSANSSLNRECDNIKARLMRVIFPKNPQHRSGIYEIILKAKE